jgi:hypothetical protein
MLACGVLGKEAILEMIKYFTALANEGKVDPVVAIKQLLDTTDNIEQKINIYQVVPDVLLKTYPFLTTEEKDNLVPIDQLPQLERSNRQFQDREALKEHMYKEGILDRERDYRDDPNEDKRLNELEEEVEQEALETNEPSFMIKGVIHNKLAKIHKGKAREPLTKEDYILVNKQVKSLIKARQTASQIFDTLRDRGYGSPKGFDTDATIAFIQAMIDNDTNIEFGDPTSKHDSDPLSRAFSKLQASKTEMNDLNNYLSTFEDEDYKTLVTSLYNNKQIEIIC